MTHAGARFFGSTLAVLFLAGSSVRADEPGWKAGAAAVRITPDKPLVLLGYPDRAGPFTSVAGDIWAKALAIEDPHGHKAVIVTADLVGFQAHTTTDPVCERLMKRTGLPRECFLFNASHTHTGPVVSLDPQRAINVGHAAMSEVDAQQTVAYTRSLQDKLTGVVLEALGKLKPATLSWGNGEVKFPVSRRMPTPNGVIMAPNKDGVVDHAVPVLRVDDVDGKLVANLFGASCHNVAAGGQNVIHGDFAGVAQAALEEKHPGVVALFMQGCGADANPQPMGSIAIAETHGKTLADEVERVLSGKLQSVNGTLSTQFAMAKLPLEPLDQETVKRYLPLPNFQARQAAHMQDLLKAGQTLLASYDAPVAAWQIGDELTLVALPGEPVAEYVGFLHDALGAKNLWIAGYDNDCFGYLPTAKVVKEGGHEAIGITLWAWGRDIDRLVGFFTPEVQDVIVKTAAELARKAGRRTQTQN
jgi:hypothetical protein